MINSPLLLLVDDSPEMAHIVGYLTRRAGQNLVCRSTVSHGWDYIQDTNSLTPDLILLDLNLPGDGGFELHRRIKEEEQKRLMPPVALFTQWAQTGLIAEMIDAGLDFFICKDLLGQPDEWKARVDEVLTLAADPPTAPTPLQVAQLRAPAVVAQSIREALSHPSLRGVGFEVIQSMAWRALDRAVATPGCQPGIDVRFLGGMVMGDLAPLTNCRPIFLSQLVRSLVYQAECLLGSVVSEPLRMALAKAVDGL